jgi:hypothetical protein
MKKYVVREIKYRTFSWLGHLERMEVQRLTEKITEPVASRRTGRPKIKWEDEVKQYLKVRKIYHRKKQAESRKEWKRII